MDPRLLEAARKGNVGLLNDLIRSNELILKEAALQGAGHTPLHVACVAGHSNFVRELLKLMPKLAEKVNADGFSPLHIVAARGDVEIARELLTVGRHLRSVKGWERRIPLHYAVVNGELHVMKLLLSAWPESIEETTAREETALHLAVKNNQFEAVVVLVEHLKQNKKEQVINWKDHKGNTALHLAAAGENFEVVKFMLRERGLENEIVEVNALNESGLTPLDVLAVSQRGTGDREIREILAHAGAMHGRGGSNSPASRPVWADEEGIQGGNSHQSDGEPVPNASRSIVRTKNLNEEKGPVGDVRNALLVVAALIASTTYQAVLQPPSYKVNVNDNSKKGLFGYGDIGRARGYIIFMSGNTFGFLASVQTIIYLTRDLPVRLPLLISMWSMALTYVVFMTHVPFTSMDKLLSAKNEALFILRPITIATLLLLTQRWWALFLDLGFLVWEVLSGPNIVGDMYNPGADPDSQITELVSKMKAHRWHWVKLLGKALDKMYNRARPRARDL